MSAPSVAVRPFRQEDEGAVLELLRASLGGGPAGDRSPAFFRWKHRHNPFGSSLLLVGEADDRVVGLRAFMRWRFRAGPASVAAVRAVDTATHPDYQGRGIFSALTREAVASLRRDTDLVFNTPNQRSGPGYLKMGWREVARVPVRLRVRRPVRVLASARSIRSPSGPGGAAPPVSAPPAAVALEDEDRLSGLLEAARRPEPRLHTDWGVGSLRWRYATASGLDYRAVHDEEGGVLRGVAIFRVRPRGRLWEAAVADVIVADGDAAAAARLLSGVIHAAPVDHVACVAPSGSATHRAARRRGFLPAPTGPTLMVNALRDGPGPDPARWDSWALSLGDLEVF